MLLQAGWTALLVAAQKGHVEVARVLLVAGADKEAAMKVGSPAAAEHVAACVAGCPVVQGGREVQGCGGRQGLGFVVRCNVLMQANP